MEKAINREGARTTRKSFEPIHEAYAFFATHATEADQNVAAIVRIIKIFLRTAPFERPLRLLDFGCGEGEFLYKLLSRLKISKGDLALYLVEPDARYRAKAAAKIAPFSSHALSEAPSIHDAVPPKLDVVVSNHMFYYVPSLEGALGIYSSTLSLAAGCWSLSQIPRMR